MLELLVAYMCISQTECNYTPRAYFIQSDDAKMLIANTETELRKITPIMAQHIISYSGPLMLILAGKEASVKITENISINGGANHLGTTLQFAF